MTVTGGTFTYDGQEHGATGSATGVAGENLTSLLTLGEKFEECARRNRQLELPRRHEPQHEEWLGRVTITKADAVVTVTGGPHLRRPGAWGHGFGDGRRG